LSNKSYVSKKSKKGEKKRKMDQPEGGVEWIGFPEMREEYVRKKK
jgi:hypothetical protein